MSWRKVTRDQSSDQFQALAHGFTLIETMITLLLVSILSSLLLVSIIPNFKRNNLENAGIQVKGLLQNAQWLALRQRRSHRLKFIDNKLTLQRKSNNKYETVIEEAVSPELTLSATRWPSFSAFGFAQGGTISLENDEYLSQIIVSPIGRIRQISTQKK